jgi:hypothetical protein
MDYDPSWLVELARQQEFDRNVSLHHPEHGHVVLDVLTAICVPCL